VDHHIDQFTLNVIIGFIKLIGLLWRKVPAVLRKFQPDLGLCGFGVRVAELAYKGIGVAALSPRLGQVGTYRTRGAPDLISE